jgi:hypothetical protein
MAVEAIPSSQRLIAAAASSEATNLASVAAQLLSQRNPGASALYWKLVLMPQQRKHNSNLVHVEELQHLHSWLALQLQQGQHAEQPSCAALEQVNLIPQTTLSAKFMPNVATWCALPDHSIASHMAAGAGASGLVYAAPSNLDRCHWHWISQPSWSASTDLPVLLVVASDAAARAWRQDINRSGSPFRGSVHVLSVQGFCAADSNSQQRVQPYDRQRLLYGLKWLAAHSPPQPNLKAS